MFLKKRKSWIKKALKFRNVTQKELAHELKMTESYLTRLIYGTRYSKTFEALLEIAKYVKFYNSKKFHASLRYKTPDKVYYENLHKSVNYVGHQQMVA